MPQHAPVTSSVILALVLLGACLPTSRRGSPTPVAKRTVITRDGVSLRDELRARLLALSGSERFLFGQQNGTIWGMYRDGAVVSTAAWFEAVRAGKWTSDGAALTGDDPAVLGVSLEMLAFEPASWNRRQHIAEAVRQHVARDGVVTADWHAPSCTATFDPAETIGSVQQGGREIPIQATRGGNFVYVEEDYRTPITSAAEVPESVTCLCKIANDVEITSGTYRGLTGKTWLLALARHTAEVFRNEQLGRLPIIVRPFHEHNGSWFWWGQPYWNCAQLLGRPDAVSGPEAYKNVVRTYIRALKDEPGMEGLLFAYSTDKLRPSGVHEPQQPIARKLADPGSVARDLLRKRLVAELTRLGLVYVSPAQQAMSPPTEGLGSPVRERRAVDQARRYYLEGYPGDDVIDLLGIDLYFPQARVATETDRRLFALQLQAVGEEARLRGKPHALTETGTYRLRLIDLANRVDRSLALTLASRNVTQAAYDRLFDPDDRQALLDHYGLDTPDDIALPPADLASVFPGAAGYTEDWYGTQLLQLARQARVAYALVWQTYHDPAQADGHLYHYVPYPGHPEADSFRRFFEDSATCFLRDRCGSGVRK